jgi:hypothetical protein
MTGIFFIAIWLVWFFISFRVALFVARRFQNFFVKLVIGLLALALLLPLPLLDEILAQPQMVALCKEGAVLKIDADRIKGRKVRLAFEPSNAMVEGTYVPIRYTRVVFRDAGSGDGLGDFARYSAQGGYLIRGLRISESNSPVFMRPSSCSPPLGAEQIAAQYQFVIVK